VTSVDGNTIAVKFAVAIGRYEIQDAVLRTKWASRFSVENTSIGWHGEKTRARVEKKYAKMRD
jgi:hypothetical protein